MQRLRRLLKRPEARHAGILTSGSMAAQVLLLATAPLLARLFPPDAFGVLALLLTVSTVGGAIGGLCYEAAIILPRSGRMARALYQLAFLLGLVVPALLTGLLGLAEHLWPHLLGHDLPPGFFVLCFFATALTTQINVLGYAHSRTGRYGPVAAAKVTQTIFPALAQIGLALAGMVGEGLLLGRVIGLMGSQMWLARGLPRGWRLGDLLPPRLPAMAVAARGYRDFLLQVPRQLLVRGATMLPAALLLASYGPVVAGFYFFAQRLIERPGALLGDSLTRVPMKQFAIRVQEDKPLVRAAVLYTAAIAVPVLAGVGILALSAHLLFQVMFGARWVPAADYALVLAGWAAIRMISLPMATLTTVLRVSRISFAVDAVFAARVLVIPALAAAGFGPLAAVGAFCGLSVIYHLATMSAGLWAARRHDRALSPSYPQSIQTPVQAGVTHV